MKQTTLEDLYYGNINPCEISFVRGSEYGKCFDNVTYAIRIKILVAFNLNICYNKIIN